MWSTGHGTAHAARENVVEPAYPGARETGLASCWRPCFLRDEGTSDLPYDRLAGGGFIHDRYTISRPRLSGVGGGCHAKVWSSFVDSFINTCQAQGPALSRPSTGLLPDVPRANQLSLVLPGCWS
jgi:hypothetical protein